jgi:hypothetical protein
MSGVKIKVLSFVQRINTQLADEGTSEPAIKTYSETFTIVRYAVDVGSLFATF